MAAAVQVIVDTWPQIIFLAMVVLAAVALSRILRIRHDITVHYNPKEYLMSAIDPPVGGEEADQNDPDDYMEPDAEENPETD